MQPPPMQPHPPTGQPGPPGPPGPPAKKSKRGLVLGLGIGGGVVGLGLVLALVAVLFAVRGGSEAEPSQSPTLRGEAWRVTAAGDDENALHSVFLARDGSLVVRVSRDGVAAYTAGDGTRKWRLTVPSEHEVCSASQATKRNVLAYVHGDPSGDCSNVVAIDVTTGEQLWNDQVGTRYRDDDAQGAAVTAAQGKVYVSTGHRVVGYDAEQGPDATGAQQPATREAPRGSCFTGDVLADGGNVTMVASCPEKYLLYRLDPETLAGKPITVKSPDTIADPTLVHAWPPVLHVDSSGGALWFLDEKGNRLAEVTGEDGKDGLDLNTSGADRTEDLHQDFPVAVAGTTLVALTARGSRTDPTRAVGFSLTTGERQWDVQVSNSGDVGLVRSGPPGKVTLLADKDKMTPVGQSESKSDRDEPQLVTLDPTKDGKMRESAQFDSMEMPMVSSTKFLLAGKRLVAVPENTTGVEETGLMLGFDT